MCNQQFFNAQLCICDTHLFPWPNAQSTKFKRCQRILPKTFCCFGALVCRFLHVLKEEGVVLVLVLKILSRLVFEM